MAPQPKKSLPRDISHGPFNMNDIIGQRRADLVWITLDTLRYDVAQTVWAAGETPNLAKLLPSGGWEKRHTPGSFTYAAHHAFFSGFLPTPATPGRHPRLFAAHFQGSETTAPNTCVFDAPTVIEGLAGKGYHTICIGGVGFFNQQTPLGCVLPSLFAEAHWSPSLGVTCPTSTAHQFALATERIAVAPGEQPLVLFINVSAIHQPNRHYIEGAERDDLRTHAAALRYVDTQIPTLLGALRGETFCMICADHGTAYGEDGFEGHRLAHESVWQVPFATCLLTAQPAPQSEERRS